MIGCLVDKCEGGNVVYRSMRGMPRSFRCQIGLRLVFSLQVLEVGCKGWADECLVVHGHEACCFGLVGGLMIVYWSGRHDA